MHISVEGCLSLKNNNKMRHFKLKRYNKIKVSGKKLLAKDKIEVQEFSRVLEKGLECVIFQHEIDHQNNILISDIGEELDIQDKLK
jgi:peptide deformylase